MEDLPSRFLRPNFKRVDLLRNLPSPPSLSAREFQQGAVPTACRSFAGELQVTVIAAQRVPYLPFGECCFKVQRVPYLPFGEIAALGKVLLGTKEEGVAGRLGLSE